MSIVTSNNPVLKSLEELYGETGDVVLIYGFPGTGKTCLAASMGRSGFSPADIADAERGTIKSLGRKRKDVRIAPISCWEDLEGFVQRAEKGKHGAKGFVIDSLTKLQDYALDYVLARRGATSDSDPTIKDYGRRGSLVVGAVNRMKEVACSQGVHVVFTATASEEKDDNTGMVLTRVGLSPKTADSVCALVDTVGYLRMTKKGDRELVLQPTPSLFAKHRQDEDNPLLGKSIINPTFGDLHDPRSTEKK